MQLGWAQWLISVIPATGEVKIMRILVQGQPRHRKKSYQDPISTKMLGIVVHICHPTYTGGVRRRIQGSGWTLPEK
jgi:hypothetical protein